LVRFGSGQLSSPARNLLFLPSRLLGVVDQCFEMHPDFSRAAGLTSSIIGAAIEVHRDKGPGLIESIYQWCLEIELGLNKPAFVSQKLVTVSYKGFSKEEPVRFEVWSKAVSWLRPKLSWKCFRFIRLSC
jgi:PD-(D/E)XK nuclease superfamily